MIKIEEVTEAETAPVKEQIPQDPNSAQDAETAEASEQATASTLNSPETDANVEGADQDLSETSEQDLQKLLAEAEKCKEMGNGMYKRGNYGAAAEMYGDGLNLAPEGQKIRAVLYANRAACHLEVQSFKEAAKDCSNAIDIDGSYLKAWHRRCKAYESLDDMDHALRDAQKVIELNPEDSIAKKTVARLQPIVAERQEKMKDEMLGKLKELGNTVLGKFGMSLDNFKTEKDPNTGSYSVNFKQ